VGKQSPRVIVVRPRLLPLLTLLCCAANTAHGQRIQFAQAPATTPNSAAPAPGFTAAPPSTYAPPVSNPYTAPAPPASTYTAPLSGTYGAPAAPATTAPWDPYAPQSTMQILPPPAALPYSSAPAAAPPSIFTPNPAYLGQPAAQPGAYGGYIQPNGAIAQPQRLRQQILFEGTWLAGGGGSELGVTDLEINATFLIPFFSGRLPLYITPGFAVHYWNGPVSESFTDTPPPELPPRTYDAYLDFGWKPVISQWLSADLGARVGLYSDFEQVESDAIRIIARGLGLITISPTAQIALGIVYLDRNNLKLLPVFGVIWMPNPDARFDILFPQPKLAYRISTVGYTQWWGYIAGELGGGAWHFQRANGEQDAYDYNDLRLIFGAEWKNQSLPGVGGYIEVGYAFNREIDYAGDNPDFDPDDTVMLRGGVTF